MWVYNVPMHNVCLAGKFLVFLIIVAGLSQWRKEYIDLQRDSPSHHYQSSSSQNFQPRNIWMERYLCPCVPVVTWAPGGGTDLIREEHLWVSASGISLWFLWDLLSQLLPKLPETGRNASPGTLAPFLPILYCVVAYDQGLWYVNIIWSILCVQTQWYFWICSTVDCGH